MRAKNKKPGGHDPNAQEDDPHGNPHANALKFESPNENAADIDDRGSMEKGPQKTGAIRTKVKPLPLSMKVHHSQVSAQSAPNNDIIDQSAPNNGINRLNSSNRPNSSNRLHNSNRPNSSNRLIVTSSKTNTSPPKTLLFNPRNFSRRYFFYGYIVAIVSTLGAVFTGPGQAATLGTVRT